MTTTVAQPVTAPRGTTTPAVQKMTVRPAIVRTAAPALLISAGYIDPGNWATDVAAGAQFGLRLIWVLAAATVAALFLQNLAARLGFAGHDLATLLRTRLPVGLRTPVVPLVLVSLVVTEVVEVFGVVIGVQLLTGLSTAAATPIAAALVLLVLVVPPGAGRLAVYGCLMMVGAVYLILLSHRGVGDLVTAIAPSELPPGGLTVAVGILGAVVMPHNILLHSTLARDVRAALPAQADPRRLLRGSLYTSGAALSVAFAVNCAITSLSASGGGGSAAQPDGGMAAAVTGLETTFGSRATALFAITLIAAGLASSVTGGMASSDVVKSLLPRLDLPAVTRRLICLVPAIGIAGSGLPAVPVLVWSQVILTVALPLLLAPLVYFTSRPDIMGAQVTGRTTRWTGAILTATLATAGVVSLLPA